MIEQRQPDKTPCQKIEKLNMRVLSLAMFVGGSVGISNTDAFVSVLTARAPAVSRRRYPAAPPLRMTVAYPEAPSDDKSKHKRRASKSVRSNIHVASTLQEYKAAVVDDADGRIVCVKFYAPWCRACKSVAPLYNRMASRYPDVKFVEVPITANTAQLQQGLGVPSLPFCHIYHPTAGLVEELKMSKPKFRHAETTLQTYIFGECLLSTDDEAKLDVGAYDTKLNKEVVRFWKRKKM